MDADKPVMKEIVRYFEQEPEGEPLDARERIFWLGGLFVYESR